MKQFVKCMAVISLILFGCGAKNLASEVRKGSEIFINDTLIMNINDILMFEIKDTTGKKLFPLMVQLNNGEKRTVQQNMVVVNVSQTDSLIEISKSGYKSYRVKLLVHENEGAQMKVMDFKIQFVPMGCEKKSSIIWKGEKLIDNKKTRRLGADNVIKMENKSE